MNVLFDVSTINQTSISGVGIYIKNLFLNLKEELGADITPAVKLSRVKYSSLISQHTNETPKVYAPFVSGGPDCIFHGPDFKLPNHIRAKTIVTIHDLAFFEEGMTSTNFAIKRQHLLKHTIEKQNPDAIITVSEFTRTKLLERYPHLESRTTAIHLGADHLDIEGAPISAPSGIDHPYFLFVGNLEARKNIVGILKSFEEFSQRNESEGIRLVIVGKPGFNYEEIKQKIESMKFKNRLIFPGYVKSEELRGYYKEALGFLYPSHHEGFGIPVIESMLLGCPVITARNSATEEVAADAALLVDSRDNESVVSAIEKMITDSSLRQQLINKGFQRAKEFTWKACATRTVKIYQDLNENY